MYASSNQKHERIHWQAVCPCQLIFLFTVSLSQYSSTPCPPSLLLSTLCASTRLFVTLFAFLHSCFLYCSLSFTSLCPPLSLPSYVSTYIPLFRSKTNVFVCLVHYGAHRLSLFLLVVSSICYYRISLSFIWSQYFI